MTDYDGNIYTSVTVGAQKWLVENLKATHYRNGDPFLNVTEKPQWDNLTGGAYCWYNNDIANKAVYGALYNWYTTVDSRNIAPVDWYVPTNPEWTVLIEYLGGYEATGGKLKESVTAHWLSLNTGADNSSGFTALPGSARITLRDFCNMNITGTWWPSTYGADSLAHDRSLHYDYMQAFNDYSLCVYGYIIRCIKNQSAGIYDLNNPDELNIYPNPADDYINLSIPAGLNETNISIIDPLGRIIFHQSKVIDHTIKIPLSAYPSGLYKVLLNNGAKRQQKTLVKQ